MDKNHRVYGEACRALGSKKALLVTTLLREKECFKEKEMYVVSGRLARHLKEWGLVSEQSVITSDCVEELLRILA